MEMEQLRQYQVEYPEFKAHFENIKEATNIAFGDYRVMRNIQTGQEVLIKPQETSSLEETEELLTTISDINIKLNSCQHFLQFLGFTEVPHEERQGTYPEDVNLIYLVFEYFQDTLEKSWPLLIKSGAEKIEDLLKRLAVALSAGFAALELIGQAHTDVSLQNVVCYTSQEDHLTHFKLIYSQYTTSAFRQVIDLHQSQSNYFLAPEIRDQLENKGRLSGGLDPQKIDVYAFGQMLLFLSAFKDPSITMEKRTTLFDNQFQQKLLDLAKKNYSPEFCGLINQMIDQDTSKRPSFQMISFQLEKMSFVQIPGSNSLQKQQQPLLLVNGVKKEGTNNENARNGSYHNLISPQLSNQIQQLEKMPLQNRAQEIRSGLFSTKRNPKNKLGTYQRNDRSVSQNPAGSHMESIQGGVYSQSTYFTPGRQNAAKKAGGVAQATPGSIQRSSYNPVSHSPYQRRAAANASSQAQFLHNSQLVNGAGSTSQVLGYRSDSRLSPYQNASKSQMYFQQQYNREYFERMLQELEQQYVLDENGQVRSDLLRKDYQDGSVYIGEIGQNDQGQEVRQGKGIYYYKNTEKNSLYSNLVPNVPFGEIYAGDWKANLFHGHGLYLFSSGERYEGDLEEGQKVGKGIYHYSNGNCYEGEWADDLKNGFGNFHFNSIGERYEGEFLNGLRNGQGTYVFQNGDIYIGQWEMGEKNGSGEVQFIDGSRFEGEWKANQPNGQGKMIYQNGDIYEGNFTGGTKEGDGVYIHKNANSKYQGSFKSDEPTGYGQFIYGNNDAYEGEIKSGQRHGKGVYTYENLDKYDGEWKFDKKNGQGVFAFTDGSLYEGQWSAGQIKGLGTMNYGNGDFYKGEWLKDKKHGKGFYKWENGNTYKGDWRNDKMNGKGLFVTKVGQTFSGMWNDNKRVAKI